ncbi:hypothetical protein D0469_19275 [Peribacillus saganii]|uniref:Uncharacterized protein n=1 Tax=Peribacillus saganii TaxID=2303992 RepID=A0A372LDH3_9BACI|nr:hypothetical protein [Peribacillus saganii]RFU64082.1 hypothetical protein D0469_19275 [Peribacillus saganii]
MKRLVPVFTILLLFITGCGKAEEKAEAEAKKAPAEESSKNNDTASDEQEDTEDTASENEAAAKEWPASFKAEKDFILPKTLEEAENMEPGEWWEKIEDNEWKDSDQLKLADKIGEIDSQDISEEKRADRVTQLLFKSLYPELLVLVHSSLEKKSPW